MNPAPRIAVSAPPRAGRPRVHVRGLASTLLGALAGLAAGAALVAGAPVVGRTVVADATPAAVQGAEAGQARGAAASSVSSVLARAIDAGVVSAPDPEATPP
jgi:hypothetical protein